MKPLKTFFLTVFTLLVIASCKKEVDNTPTPINNNTADTCVLDTIKGPGDTLQWAFEYNTNGKISKQTYYSEGIPAEYTRVYYATNKVMVNDFGMDNQLIVTRVYNTGSNGLASTCVATYGEFKYSQVFHYDADEYLIREDITTTKIHNGDTIIAAKGNTTFVITNNNVSSSIDSTFVRYKIGTDITTDSSLITETYEYRLDKAGLYAFIYNPTIIVPDLLGKSSKNLLSKSTTIDNSVTKIRDYTYEFDSSGKAIKSTMNFSSSYYNFTQVKFYNYSCK